MKTFRTISLALAILLSAGISSFAQRDFSANITHDQEPGAPGITPPTTTTGAPRPLSFGTATFTLNAAMTQLSMIATIFNIDVGGQTPDINDNLLNAHIHVGAPPGSNAPVRWGFFGSPDNDTMPKQLSLVPFASGVGGTFTSIWDLPEGNAGTTLATNLPQIFANLSYINFHTQQFMGGEIRGQIIVPEPVSTGALLALGVFGMLGFGWMSRTHSPKTERA